MSEIVNVTVIFPDPVIKTVIIEKIGPRGPAGGTGEGGGGGVTDHGELTGLGDDDHTQYLTNERGDARYDAKNAASTALTSHTGAPDPHPQYTTASEAAAAAPVQSVAGRTGAIVLTKADVGLNNLDNTSDANKPVSTAQQAAIDAAINELINGSPAALDTLLELAGAMGNDPNFAATVTNSLATKVDKITGKGLSTEDFTSALLAKLNGIASGATANATDAALRARASHTGTQLAATISDFAAAVAALRPGALGFSVEAKGGIVSTGDKGELVAIRSGTITGWWIAAKGTNPTATIDIWKNNGGSGLPTVLNSIVAAAKPALATGNVIRSTTTTGWTLPFNAGDTFRFNVDAVANAERLTFCLETN